MRELMRTARCLLDKDKITTPTGVASNVYLLVTDCPFRKKYRIIHCYLSTGKISKETGHKTDFVLLTNDYSVTLPGPSDWL